MKLQLVALAAVIAAAVIVFFFYEPESREARVGPAPVAVAPPPAPEIPAPPPKPEQAPAPIPAPDAAPPPPDAAAADAAPTGPFTIDLGERTIHLRDKPWVLHVHPQLVTSSFVTRNEIARSRRALVRMLFFLASHRTKDGSEGADGQARFEADFIERIRNQIKTGPVDELKLLRYEVAEFVPPDAGADPGKPQ